LAFLGLIQTLVKDQQNLEKKVRDSPSEIDSLMENMSGEIEKLKEDIWPV